MVHVTGALPQYIPSPPISSFHVGPLDIRFYALGYIIGITLAILLAALPLLGEVHAISSWVPTALVGAPADLVTSPPGDDLAHFAPALGVSAVTGALALAAAVLRLQARET